MDIIAGFDFGTFNSSISIYINGKIHNLEIIPSIVNIDENDIVTVGYDTLLKNPLHTIKNIKRIIGKTLINDENNIYNIIENINGYPLIELKYGDVKKYFSAVEITSYILKKMKEVTINYLLSHIPNTTESTITDLLHIVLTIPAYFNNDQRIATMESAIMVKLNIIRLINEPTAASITYGVEGDGFTNEIGEENRDEIGVELGDKIMEETPTENPIENPSENTIENPSETTGETPIVKDVKKVKNIMVFDFGGGTCDVTLLKLCNNVHNVIASVGDNDLGGENVTLLLVKYIISQLIQEYNINIKDITPRNLILLKELCEECKQKVNINNKPSLFYMNICGINVEINITLNILNDVCIPIISKIDSLIDKILIDSKISNKDLDEIVLVGGSCKLICVKQYFRNKFNNNLIYSDLNTETIVSTGACIYGCIINKIKFKNTSDFLLFDVAPLPIGIKTDFDKMDVIIPKNSKIPCIKSKDFTNIYDNQTELNIQVYEGTSLLCSENTFLEQFEFKVKRLPAFKGRYTFTFELNESGILTVTAKENNCIDDFVNSTNKKTLEEILNESKKENIVKFTINHGYNLKELACKDKIGPDIPIKQIVIEYHLLYNMFQQNKQLLLKTPDNKSIKQILYIMTKWFENNTLDKLMSMPMTDAMQLVAELKQIL